jgi:hypothetical protein
LSSLGQLRQSAIREVTKEEAAGPTCTHTGTLVFAFPGLGDLLWNAVGKHSIPQVSFTMETKMFELTLAEKP